MIGKNGYPKCRYLVGGKECDDYSEARNQARRYADLINAPIVILAFRRDIVTQPVAREAGRVWPTAMVAPD
jgi:hypothetical protein